MYTFSGLALAVHVQARECQAIKLDLRDLRALQKTSRYTAMLFADRMWKTVSLSESLAQSQLATPVACNPHHCRTCTVQQTPAGLRRNRLRTSRRAAHGLLGGADQRSVSVSAAAAVAAQDFATLASDEVADSSEVQTFLQWLAIQGLSCCNPSSACQAICAGR